MHLKTSWSGLEPSWRHRGGVLAPYWPVLAPSWAFLGASWPPKSLPKLVQNPSWGPHKTRSNIDPNLESLGGPKTLKFFTKNQYFYKSASLPLTQNGDHSPSSNSSPLSINETSWRRPGPSWRQLGPSWERLGLAKASQASQKPLKFLRFFNVFLNFDIFESEAVLEAS